MPYETVRDFCAFLAAELKTDAPLVAVLPVADDHYAPPELVDFDHMGARGKVYQAGQLLLELLTHEEPSPDAVVPTDLPEPLRDVLLRSLAHHFEDRPRDLPTLLAELHAVLPALDPLRQTWMSILDQWRQTPTREFEEELIDAAAVAGHWDELLGRLDDRNVAHRAPGLWLRARIEHDFKRDPAAAEAILVELVQLGDRDAVNKLAGLYRHQERWRTLEDLLATHGDTFDHLVELGKLQATLGLRRRAMRTFRKALAMNPDDPRAALPLGRLVSGTSHPALTRPPRQHAWVLAALVMGTIIALGAGVALSSARNTAIPAPSVVAPRAVETGAVAPVPHAVGTPGVLVDTPADWAPEPAPATDEPEEMPREMTIALDETQMVQTGSMRPIALAGAEFTMGRPGGGAYGELRPHAVRFTRSFEMMPTEVTRALWNEITDTNPAGTECPDCPVTSVSWFEAVHFANELSHRDGLPACYALEECRGAEQIGVGCGPGVEDCGGGFNCARAKLADPDCRGYRLPTEAEWEFVARHGGTRLERAWYAANSRGQLQPVGGLDADDYGVHDLLGNAWEWTWDQYDIYPLEPQVDPLGPGPGDRRRIYRGGAYNSFSQRLDPTFRNKAGPNFRAAVLGFRLVRTLGGVGAR